MERMGVYECDNCGSIERQGGTAPSGPPGPCSLERHVDNIWNPGGWVLYHNGPRGAHYLLCPRCVRAGVTDG